MTALLEARVWEITVVASFEADNAEDAETICERLLDRVIEHPSAIEGEVSCVEVIAKSPASCCAQRAPERR